MEKHYYYYNYYCPKCVKLTDFRPSSLVTSQPQKEQFQFCNALFKNWLLLRRVGADAAKEQSL